MRKLTFISAFLLLISFQNTVAQSQEKAYALLIMSFAKNIQWPTQTIGNTFTIGIMGYPPLASEIIALSQAKVIAGKQILIKEINSPEEVNGCEIIFVPGFKSKKITEILKQIGNSSTLVVTNVFQLPAGSGINLILKDGKLAYQISNKSLEQRGLKVPSSIKNMGTVID